MKMTISIGSNLEDPVAEVNKAIDQIAETFTLLARSSLYRTEPIGGPEQPHYINAVVIIESQLAPKDVLTELQGIEAKAGRVRDIRWGPRILDLDLINVDGIESQDSDCTLPHPRAKDRAFVLTPWLEADPEAELVGVGKVRELLIPDQEVVRL